MQGGQWSPFKRGLRKRQEDKKFESIEQWFDTEGLKCHVRENRRRSVRHKNPGVWKDGGCVLPAFLFQLCLFWWQTTETREVYDVNNINFL